MRRWSQLTTRKKATRSWYALVRLVSERGPVRRPLSHAWYWLRTHTWDRYHIVDCRSPQNGYSWGWCDRDELMLCACFNILVDFVEREMLVGPVDWDCDNTVEYRDELMALYDWWKSGRAGEHRLAWSSRAQHSSFDVQKMLDDKDDEMLARLMRVRSSLWT